ncbi:hypothetical protein GCM10027429_33000 [Marivirga atlantica]|uniref:Endonuclease n=1 Tax=Marivirga atlantica TaxID=1548457 RepID=A0A937DG71_9BACT|nr:endonuclease [Marivirga atlantica]MBL0766877.1 endonuclease [Marivirga atlantica]
MKHLYTFLLLLFVLSSNAQAPSGYYDGANGLNGEELKLALHKIIRGHKVFTYGDFRDEILPTLDEDPDNSDNIILFYKNASIPKANFASNNQQDFWNREHTWPKSHGFPDESDTAYTDVHNLRPSDASVNTSKSNKDFNDVENISENAEGEAPDTYTNSDFWDPRDEIKGDVARILFYMATRYESDFLDLELVDRISGSNDPELGVLYTLIKWHEQDPVDQYEIDRHEGAYGYQENRNPFIDHPEWVSEIWGSTTAPTLIIDQRNFNPDFGYIPLGESLVQTYTINAYNLESDISVSVASPFFVSTDGNSFSSEITLSDDGSEAQTYTVYLKYEPANSDESIVLDVTHTTTGDTENFEVQGNEGEKPILTIQEARQKSLDDVVTVAGVVIDAGNNSDDNRVIYDGTAGIMVRSFDTGNESANYTLGDSILVTGGLGSYNELLQIEKSPITIELLKSNATLPEPQEITIAEVGESYESELVTIKNVTFNASGATFQGSGGAGNFDINDGTGTMIFRIGSDEHPLVGSTVPSGTYNITGFIGQFQSDYQISVRDANDLVLADETQDVELTTINAARNKSLGSLVKVSGVVIDNGNNNAINRVIYDGTAGIVVRGTDLDNESANLNQGDSVVVTGGLSEYNGWMEIEESPVLIEVIRTDASLPNPKIVTIDEVGESLESQLITIEGVQFVESGDFTSTGFSGDFTISDGTNELKIRIGSAQHPLVDQSIPGVKLNITGFVGQDNDYYHISPRTEEDIELLEDEPLAISGYQLSKNVIYPNPSKNTIYINIDGESSKSIDKMLIYSVDGQLQKHILNINAHESVDISSLEAGLYTVILTSDDQNFVYKLVKK